MKIKSYSKSLISTRESRRKQRVPPDVPSSLSSFRSSGRSTLFSYSRPLHVSAFRTTGAEYECADIDGGTTNEAENASSWNTSG